MDNKILEQITTNYLLLHTDGDEEYPFLTEEDLKLIQQQEVLVDKGIVEY